MMKILDVSNSSKRPPSRGLGGPLENDIVRYLKKYAHKFDCKFVDNEKDADLVFTNDAFPKEYSRPKVKRMDGVYSRIELLERNHNLNLSAEMADCVVFISEFSKLSLQKIYPFINVKQCVVALNSADPTEFFPIKDCSKEYHFISTANDWKRPEKRGDLFIKLAEHFPEYKFALIGKPQDNLPTNVYSTGYISDYSQLNAELNKAESFVYLGFNDPAPKTVCQALNCNIPLFLTRSGGNGELAHPFASFTEDSCSIPVVHMKIPDMNFEKVLSDFKCFINSGMTKEYQFPSKEKFETMLETYFNTFKLFK